MEFNNTKVNIKPIEVKFNEDSFNITPYLPVKDKYDIIEITLQNAQDGVIFNPIKIDMYFSCYLVFSYTDIKFSEEEKQNIEITYDALCTSGLLDAVLKNIPETEYNYLYEALQELKESKTYYASTISSLTQELINNLPEQAQAVEKIIQNFDPEKFQQIIQFAQQANGNRDIETNLPVE